MSSKERISTRAESKERRKITLKAQNNFKHFEIFYNQEKILTIEIQANQTVRELNRLLKNKIKDRFYNFIGLQSVCGLEVLDFALQNKDFSLVEIHQGQKLRILLEGQVHDLNAPTINDFNFMKCLGKGGSSTVYLVRHKQNCRMYALKQVEKSYITDFKKMEFLLRQKKILTEIVKKSQFSSRIYATFESKDHLNFLLEYYPGGQILYHLQDRRMKEEEIKLYFCQVLTAIQNLHRQKIIFRDLKPQNILIDFKGNAILSDFGLCKTIAKNQELTISCCGSDIYMPPEVKTQTGYSYHVDFYTLGAFLYEMISGLPPYYNNQTYLDFPEKTSLQAIQLCLKLLEPDLKKRLCDFKAIKQTKWLQNISWKTLNDKQYKMSIKLNLYKTYIHEDFREPLTFDQINQTIFDRLFDFFFYVTDDAEDGISNCYVIHRSKIKNPFSDIGKEVQKGENQKIKQKQKSQKKSTDKFNKLLGKGPQLQRMKEKSKKKSQKSYQNNQKPKQGKSKSYKKRSTQNSPCIHNLNKQRKKQRQTLKGQKEQKQRETILGNIYQKVIKSPIKIQMKNVKGGNLTSRSSFRPPQLNKIMQSPFSKRKNT